jgi:hypothetical protein
MSPNPSPTPTWAYSLPQPNSPPQALSAADAFDSGPPKVGQLACTVDPDGKIIEGTIASVNTGFDRGTLLVLELTRPPALGASRITFGMPFSKTPRCGFWSFLYDAAGLPR